MATNYNLIVFKYYVINYYDITRFSLHKVNDWREPMKILSNQYNQYMNDLHVIHDDVKCRKSMECPTRDKCDVASFKFELMLKFIL